ncbi:MAG: OmpA family protein [Curvibacter lanceolatus]|uniref:OmpA family protein n=1 Tax=Curvibacter lanceolatus TaxID=86182 RepID=UPI0003AA7588|nr:OmpA family protein [Curvibacter lanceolatus]MBV5294757.1 OmpA family protein [Curvibacter lanceolatus]
MRKNTPSSLILIPVLAVGLLSGCADMSENQRRTGAGAGIGALAGAVLSSATGGNAGTGAVVGAGIGALGTYIWSRHMDEQKRAMEQATQGTGVTVVQTADNQLKLDIPSDISFDTGSAVVKPNLRPILDRFAEGLRNNPRAEVRIVGHTDSTGSDAVNNPLSQDRAASTRDYLVARGVPFDRFMVEGRGSHQPVASNDTADGRARNRRVEIFVGEKG